jgi:hypothetical protein
MSTQEQRSTENRPHDGSVTDPGPLVLNDGTELREGYAALGDQSLHYVEAGTGPLIVLLHGFPEFWFGWRLQIGPLVAAGFRVSRARHAWLQPVIEAGGLRGLRRRPGVNLQSHAHRRAAAVCRTG